MNELLNHADLGSLFRNFIGADLFDRLNSLPSSTSGYPPYNLERNGEDSYRLTLAVAGFTKDEITIVRERDVLTISGEKKDKTSDSCYLHRGIAMRDFSRSFLLGEYVEVKSATLDNGLLVINLAREIPEQYRAINIEIK